MSEVESLALAPDVLVSGGTHLFGIASIKQVPQLVQINPAERKTTATAAVPNGALAPQVAGRYVWVVAPSMTHKAVLTWYSLSNAHRMGSSEVTGLGTDSSGPQLATNSSGSYIFVSIDDSVQRVNPHTGGVGPTYEMPGAVVALALTPNSSRLYAEVENAGGSVTLLVINPTSGKIESKQPVRSKVVESSSDFVATTGGLWHANAGGMSSLLGFSAANNLAHGRTEATGGGGATPTVQITQNVAWIGDRPGQQISCADPNTGVVRSSTSNGDSSSKTLGGFASIGKNLYAIYANRSSSAEAQIVRVTAPATCKAS